MTRDEPSRFWPKLLISLLAIGALVGGAAGYRYYTLGYILPGGESKLARLAMVVAPATADVRVDSRPVGAGVVTTLAPGEEHPVVVRADGYLAMRAAFKPGSGQQLRVDLHMGHKMPALQQGAAASPGEVPTSATERTPKAIVEGYEKLAGLADCGTRLSTALQGALPASDDGEPSPVAYGLTDECRLVIEVLVAKAPEFSALDPGTTSLVERVVALNEALRAVQGSAAASPQEQRTIRTALRRASSSARKERKKWLATMNRTYANWLREDALRVREREGSTLHSTLRDLTCASDAWSRASLGGVRKLDSFRKALDSALEVAKADAAKRAGVYANSGGAGLVLLVEKLVADDANENVLEAHNAVVTQFNELVLPIRFDGTK